MRLVPVTTSGSVHLGLAGGTGHVVSLVALSSGIDAGIVAMYVAIVHQAALHLAAFPVQARR
ncbi:hypothetical protein GCM10010433_53310 [Streptomyces pulveraceus]